MNSSIGCRTKPARILLHEYVMNRKRLRVSRDFPLEISEEGYCQIG